VPSLLVDEGEGGAPRFYFIPRSRNTLST
jgi:hypothetical protein